MAKGYKSSVTTVKGVGGATETYNPKTDPYRKDNSRLVNKDQDNERAGRDRTKSNAAVVKEVATNFDPNYSRHKDNAKGKIPDHLLRSGVSNGR